MQSGLGKVRWGIKKLSQNPNEAVGKEAVLSDLLDSRFRGNADLSAAGSFEIVIKIFEEIADRSPLTNRALVIEHKCVITSWDRRRPGSAFQRAIFLFHRGDP